MVWYTGYNDHLHYKMVGYTECSVYSTLYSAVGFWVWRCCIRRWGKGLKSGAKVLKKSAKKVLKEVLKEALKEVN